jgi:hypothetical protein
MDYLPSLIEQYVAVWNEPDTEMRRRRIATVWVPNGTTCYRLLDARGHEAIEARVTGSWDRWVREGKFIFCALKAVRCQQAIRLNFAMLATNSGKVEANGLSYLLVDQNDRIVHDYQFNPSVHDAPDLASRYLACRDEADVARRKILIGELWAENGALISEAGEARRGGELASAIEATCRGRLANNLGVSTADRSQHHHHVAHIGWHVATGDSAAPISAASALVVFDNDGRIDTAYEFTETKAA